MLIPFAVLVVSFKFHHRLSKLDVSICYANTYLTKHGTISDIPENEKRRAEEPLTKPIKYDRLFIRLPGNSMS